MTMNGDAESQITIDNININLSETIENTQIISSPKKSRECKIWKEIMDTYYKEKNEIEEYLRKKHKTDEQVTLNIHPLIAFLNKSVFPVLLEGMIEMLQKVGEEKSHYRPKSSFNGLDFLSEYLYNSNPRYPHRRANWTYIFDIAWVEKLLQESPRPYFPFSLIWTREYAALKIQSFIRGYFVRRREDVQEVRTFWKEYKQTNLKHESQQ